MLELFSPTGGSSEEGDIRMSWLIRVVGLWCSEEFWPAKGFCEQSWSGSVNPEVNGGIEGFRGGYGTGILARLFLFLD